VIVGLHVQNATGNGNNIDEGSTGRPAADSSMNDCRIAVVRSANQRSVNSKNCCVDSLIR
jgi:hypothetical protein